MCNILTPVFIRQDLFSINLTTSCDTHDLLRCDCASGCQENRAPVAVAEQRPFQLGAPAKHVVVG